MGRGLAIAQSIADAAAGAGLEARLYLDHPASVPDDWIPSPTEGAVIAIGGDGTLRCVVDRLLTLLALGQPIPPVLVVPLGTANLVARHLDCRWRPDRLAKDVLQAIGFGHRRKLDIATANGGAMLAVGGVGFDGKVIHELAARRRGPITYADYLLPTMKSIADYVFHPLSVEVDGHALCVSEPGIVFVGNVPEYGAGFSVTPAAKSDDGLLDVCLLPCRNWTDLFDLGVLCGSGLQVNSERSHYVRGKHVKVTSPAKLPVQVDGEACGFTPVIFDLLSQHLTFIVPART